MAYAVTYGSGLSAIFAVFQLIQPKRILTSTGGYNGTHGIIEMYMRGRSVVIQCAGFELVIHGKYHY